VTKNPQQIDEMSQSIAAVSRPELVRVEPTSAKRTKCDGTNAEEWWSNYLKNITTVATSGFSHLWSSRYVAQAYSHYWNYIHYNG
jgi:hypothetical protein